MPSSSPSSSLVSTDGPYSATSSSSPQNVVDPRLEKEDEEDNSSVDASRRPNLFGSRGLETTRLRGIYQHDQGALSPPASFDPREQASSEPPLPNEQTTTSLTPGERVEVYRVLQRHAVRGKFDTVSKLVQELVQQMQEEPSRELYSALILVNISRAQGSAAMVETLLKEMDDEGIEPDSDIYHHALKALAVHPNCLLRAKILAEMKKKWFSLTIAGWHDVIAGYLREGLVEQALESLDGMRDAGFRVQGWLYDMVVYVFCEVRELDEALDIMKYRIHIGEDRSSAGAWYYLLDSACGELHYETIQLVWDRRVAQNYLNPTSGQCLAVLNAAARHGDIQLATDVFRVLSKRATTFESHHYELLIEAYIKAEDLKTALAIFCIMSNTGLAASQSATSSISQYLRESPERQQKAFEILEEMKEDRAVPTEAVNRIIEASVSSQGLDKAIEVYHRLHRICAGGPNVNTFNALFVGCRDEGRKDTAMFLASEMLHLKVRPNALTYDRLALICLNNGDLDDALRYYSEMRAVELIPRSGTMTNLIHACADAGNRRAWGLLENMGRFGFDQSAARQYVMHRLPEERVEKERNEEEWGEDERLVEKAA